MLRRTLLAAILIGALLAPGKVPSAPYFPPPQAASTQ